MGRRRGGAEAGGWRAYAAPQEEERARRRERVRAFPSSKEGRKEGRPRLLGRRISQLELSGDGEGADQFGQRSRIKLLLLLLLLRSIDQLLVSESASAPSFASRQKSRLLFSSDALFSLVSLFSLDFF